MQTGRYLHFLPAVRLGKRQPAGALIAFMAGVLLGGVSFAGEKIQITETADKVELPKEGTEQQAITPGFVPSRIGSPESGRGTVMPQPNQPLMIRNPKLMEAVDKKQNWIFDSPNSLDRNRTIEETFGVRSYDLDDLERKPKGVVESYFDSNKPGQKGTKGVRESKDGLGRDSARRPGEMSPSRLLESKDEHEKTESPGIIPELNPAQLFNNWNLPADPLSQMNGLNRNPSILPRSAPEPVFGASAPGQASVGENSLLSRGSDNAWNLNKGPIGKFNDPINDPNDPTRAIMNPIAARKASVPPPEASRSRLGDSYSFGSPASVSARPDFIGPGRDIGSTPSFIPAKSVTAPAPLMQAKPAILEIPRPKF